MGAKAGVMRARETTLAPAAIQPSDRGKNCLLVRCVAARAQCSGPPGPAARPVGTRRWPWAGLAPRAGGAGRAPLRCQNSAVPGAWHDSCLVVMLREVGTRV